MTATNYGDVRVYGFRTDTNIFGPAQIEARIDQDPQISQQISLWNQSGSSVVRGNLIVVPVGDSLIYLQPVYLQSTSGALPEFQKIVVASPTTIVWGDSLTEALNLLLERQGELPGPAAHTHARAVTGSHAGAGGVRDAWSNAAARRRAAHRRCRPDRLREHALRVRAARAPRRVTSRRTATEMDKVEAALRELTELTGVASPQP